MMIKNMAYNKKHQKLRNATYIATVTEDKIPNPAMNTFMQSESILEGSSLAILESSPDLKSFKKTSLILSVFRHKSDSSFLETEVSTDTAI